MAIKVIILEKEEEFKSRNKKGLAEIRPKVNNSLTVFFIAKELCP